MLARHTPDPADYLPYVEKSGDELSALAGSLTVGETYFLRQPEQFAALARTVLPERLARSDRPANLPLQVLSAGCASGEEAYSLAITLSEAGHPGAKITGLDVNPLALAKARTGQYTSWSMRAVPAPTQRRWFTQDGGHYLVNQGLRDAVEFRRQNLAGTDHAFWRPSFDVIFCRNVLMYFAPEKMAEAVRRLQSALLPGGYLFLGSAETLRGVSDDFGLCEAEGVFYYRLLDPAATPRVVPKSLPAQRGPSPQERESFGQVLDLVRAERFEAALGAIELIETPSSPPRTPWETEVMLVRAMLLTHSGDLSGASRDAHRLLGRGGDVAADAHAVLATCRESTADDRGALLHWKAAVNADPAFALGHLNIGRLNRLHGDLSGSNRSYDRAADLLILESERRVMLFGGGFDREALLSVCRTIAHGGRS
ncbi:CheR family methyltransferase [Kineosporia babensis]|uniref:Methyltransferase domain-containing protein n=1 Tax=Kineosporia babensis TaxID=499548 RepID=A0A9X1N8H3_9ACTN|nr:CheR family methyltransferase [Kineosporia babensis]MCD5310327.1 methyltransferase domain-containing protein [Kineosporia babensis]